MKSEQELILENYVKACEISWRVYRDWKVGGLQDRQFFMKVHMKDWVIAEALLVIERRKRVQS